MANMILTFYDLLRHTKQIQIISAWLRLNKNFMVYYLDNDTWYFKDNQVQNEEKTEMSREKVEYWNKPISSYKDLQTENVYVMTVYL